MLVLYLVEKFEERIVHPTQRYRNYFRKIYDILLISGMIVYLPANQPTNFSKSNISIVVRMVSVAIAALRP